MSRILKSLAIVVLAIFLFIQCGTKSDNVATVGSSEISVEEFTALLKQRYPKVKDFSEIEEKTKRTILNQAIQNKLKYLAALDLELDEDPEISKTIKKNEENLLGQKYYEVVVVDKLISEEEIREFNEKQGYSFKSSHILVAYRGSRMKGDRTKEEAAELAKSLSERAKNGEDFDQLIFEYSDDPQAKNPKAKSNSFKWGQKPKPYQEACWNLNTGEISDVVDTDFGFFIIRLDEKNEDPNYKLDESPQTILNIKRTLYGAVADSGKKMWEKHIEELKKSKSFTLHDENLNKLSQILNERTKSQQVALEDFSDEEKNIELATWNGGDITFTTILERYSDNLVRVLNALKDPSKLKREVQNLSLITMAVADAKNMGLDDDESIRDNIDKLKESRMSYLVEQRMVNDKISFTDEEVQKYYDEHPDNFMNPEKREMWEITFKDEATAKKVAAMAKKGYNFEKLAKKYSTSKYYKDKGGYLGFRTVNSRGTISKKAFDMKPNGEISEPFKFKNEWAIVKTGKVQEKKLRPFQKVSRMVEGRLRNDLLKDRRKEWNEELREKYPVNINEEALQKV